MNAITLEPGLRRLTAPNPSPMTFEGTNTFLLGERDIAVIDPGPASSDHLNAILGSLQPHQQITMILVTHSHLDHSPLATMLSHATGAPILAAGPSDWGRSAVMQHLADEGLIGGGEGVDSAFAPDRQLKDRDRLQGDGFEIEVVDSPGHMANHLSFVWNDALFSGDIVMGWSTSLISPPDGDLTAFRNSLMRMMERDDRVYYPAHGEAVHAPRDRCHELLTHREGREKQILDVLSAGAATATKLTAQIYTDIPPALLPVAERNVLAHLIDLTQRNLIAPTGKLSAGAQFQRL